MVDKVVPEFIEQKAWTLGETQKVGGTVLGNLVEEIALPGMQREQKGFRDDRADWFGIQGAIGIELTAPTKVTLVSRGELRWPKRE